MKVTIDEFIKNHKHYNYCEAIIYPDGLIDYATPSHMEALHRFTGENVQKLYDECVPLDSSPIQWFVEYTNCVAVWLNYSLVPRTPSKEQIATLNKLLDSDLTNNVEVVSLNQREIDSIIEARKREQDSIKLISTGEPSTLETYRKIAYMMGGFKENKATEFIDEKIEKSSQGKKTEVIADERQMLYLLASLITQE